MGYQLLSFHTACACPSFQTAHDSEKPCVLSDSSIGTQLAGILMIAGEQNVKKDLACGWRVGLDTGGNIGWADVIWSFGHLRLALDIVFSIQIEEGNLLALCKPWVTLYKLSSEICDEHSNKTRPNTKTLYLLSISFFCCRAPKVPFTPNAKLMLSWY
jgi:hypothetical protein